MTIEIDDECGLVKYIDGLKARAELYAQRLSGAEARLKLAEAETLEQCRLLGKSGSREAHLLAVQENMSHELMRLRPIVGPEDANSIDAVLCR